jgi:hypothetical protein
MGDDSSIGNIGMGSTPGACDGGTGWGCNVPSCGGNPSSTVLTGKVYDPAGKNPLYNVEVFIPQDPSTLPHITLGTKTCNTCEDPIGNFVVAAATDSTGSFTLAGVPAGKGVPVVVQIGKWRRIIPVNINPCATNAVPTAALRLPRNHGEGDMPQMALVTGGLDDLGCFMRRMGIDAAEYTTPGPSGRLNVYQGMPAGVNLGGVTLGGGAPGLSNGTAGNCTSAACPLWASKASFENYDIVILACEGAEHNETKPASAMTALHDWLNEGGKVFATHFHYTWYKNSPATEFQNVATWLGSSIGNGMGNYTINTMLPGGMPFPKGQAFERWLDLVGGANGATIALNGVANSVSVINPMTTFQWIYDPMTTGGGEAGPAAQNTKYLSFNTPIGGIATAPTTADGGGAGGEPQLHYCGKAVFSDLHAASSPSGDVPAACKLNDLSPQEKALEVLFFDLSACVQDDHYTPPPPPQPK